MTNNLINNAIKFADTYSVVKINVGYEDEDLKVSVANSGLHLRYEEIPSLYKPYQKLSTARNKEGTGLGLYISKKISSEI